MKPEARLWAYVREGMGQFWSAQRHEDKLTSGIPDLSYATNVHGWIELKVLPNRPKRDNDLMEIKHFTADQRNWLSRFGTKAGFCFLLLKVADTYMLFGHESAREIGRVSYEMHELIALKVWHKSIIWMEFRDAISRPHPLNTDNY